MTTTTSISVDLEQHVGAVIMEVIHRVVSELAAT